MRSLMKIVTFLFLVVIAMIAVSCDQVNKLASSRQPAHQVLPSESQMSVSIFADQNGLLIAGSFPPMVPLHSRLRKQVLMPIIATSTRA